jgi:hypothetical protein
VTSQQKNNGTNDNSVITCYVNGIPHTQTISFESGLYLKELFSTLAIANAHDPCSAETQFLQQQILTYAEQHGLLPGEMSADVLLAQLNKKSQDFAAKNAGGVGYPLGVGREMFCNFVSTGEGAAFPIIILPRFIPFIMAPIPRLFVGWKTPLGVTSCGGLLSRTGFYAVGEQQGLALGFWGIGFSIFLPPVMAYGMFGYALFAKASAQYMEFYPPNHPPEITPTYPLDGASYVPLSTSELRFSISDYDSDLMSYSVTTYPDVGGGNGNMKPDGTYTVPISGLKSSTVYTWHVTVSDGMDTVEEEFTFTTEAVAPVVSEVLPVDGDRYVPVSQGFLRFHLRDPQNDLMSYTVETSPHIGSGSGSGVGEGDISVPISGLEVMTEYRWFVNVTDGVNPTSEVFWFRTEPLMVFDPFAEGWEYRKMITVNHTMVADDLEYFPVLLDITDNDLKDKAQEDGDDILFMNGAGVATRVYHELEEFDGSSGRLVAWVNVSSLSSSVDTSLYLYYGNLDSDNQQCPEKTWDSHYLAVWHMDDATDSTIEDSTFNNYKGTKIASNEPAEIYGKVGKSQDFDGANDHIDFINPVIPLGTKTISFWLKIDVTAGDYWFLVNGDIHSNLLSGTGFYTYTPNKLGILIGNGAEPDYFMKLRGTDAVDIPDSTYYHYYYASYDGTTLKLAIDAGTPKITTIKSGTEAQPSNNLIFGRCVDNYPYNLNGQLDEIRISDICRDPNWISAEYNNMNNFNLFISVGPEETHP